MADNIARQLVKRGIKKIRIHDASKTHPSYIINDIFRFRGVILGSCAYNGGLFPAMGTLIHELQNMALNTLLFLIQLILLKHFVLLPEKISISAR